MGLSIKQSVLQIAIVSCPSHNRQAAMPRDTRLLYHQPSLVLTRRKMRLVTYTFRGATRTGAMLGENEVVDLNRAETLRLRQAGDEAAETRAAFHVPSNMLAFLRAGDVAVESA